MDTFREYGDRLPICDITDVAIVEGLDSHRWYDRYYGSYSQAMSRLLFESRESILYAKGSKN